jgi:O-succinylhomoserine sulfhydrylase
VSAWGDAVDSNTKMLFMETPSNPTNDVVSIREIAAIAQSVGALLAVDNCFSTPALQRPIEHGADLVVHSATKFLDGQGRVVGGAVCGKQALIDELVVYVRTCGPTMSPFNAWVFLKGLETLSLRMKAHSANAMDIAQWLEAQPSVGKVNYCGLPSHSSHAAASEQMSGYGSVMSFTVSGGQAGAWAFIDATRICSLTANLGDAKTTIVHPATTTHGRISQAERDAAGISDDLIRVCVGLEDVEDLRADLARGLAAAEAVA